MSNGGRKAIKRSERNAFKASRARRFPANERTRHERKLASGRKTRG